MQTFVRAFVSILFPAMVAGCTVPAAELVDDLATAQGTLGDGTPFAASASVFGGLVDDGSATMPPMDATFQVTSGGSLRKLEVRAPLSNAMPPRGPPDVMVCLSNEAPGHTDERCDTPDVVVDLDQDSADCSDHEHGGLCVVVVDGEVTITNGTLFNGTVRVSHHEQSGSAPILAPGEPIL